MIAKEGLFFIAIPAVTGILFLFIGRTTLVSFFGYLLIAAGLFCAYFFRDPARAIPEGMHLVLSPCDGTVMETLEENNEKVIRVFLSVFNVHIQRSPVSGKLERVEYKPGKFLPADNARAHAENEQNVFTISTKHGAVTVKQIAGIIARRVVAWSKAGDELKSGDKIGIIKFGSQVDIHLPLSAKIKVKAGDKVTGGETVIGEFGQ